MTNNTVQLVEILNPLNSRERVVTQHSWRLGLTVADLVPAVEGVEFAVSRNGGIVPMDELRSTAVAPGDFVVYAPVPAGGEGGKSILRIVALIAVAYFAPYLVSNVVGVTGAAAIGSAGVAALNVGAIMAGTALVNALLPPPKPTTRDSSEQEASYGADGPKNMSAEGVAVPVPYGTYRVGGNIVGQYTVTKDHGTSIFVGEAKKRAAAQTQWLHMLINLGEGPIESIEDILINDQPIDTFVYRPEGKDADEPAYEVEKYLGTADQSPPKWFEKSITPVPVQAKLTQAWSQWSTSAPVDQLRVDVVAPTGLFRVWPDGSDDFWEVDVEVQITEAGTENWRALNGAAHDNTVATYRMMDYTMESEGQGVQHYQRPYEPFGGERRVGNTLVDMAGNVIADITTVPNVDTNGVFKLRANQRGSWRTSILTGTLAEGNYDVRYRRVLPEEPSEEVFDDIYVSDINEIRDETVAFRNTALLALKLRMTDKLNNVPTVTSLVKGRKLRVWDKPTGAWKDEVWTANPAWVAYDMLTHKRYGGGSPASRFDLERWKEWAEYCEGKFEFNGIFDTTSTTWDALQEVFRAGHAQLVPQGTRFSVAIDRPEQPVMMFSAGNIVDGTFKLTWLPTSERANEVELTYQDAEDDYKQRTIKAIDTSAVSAGRPQKTASISMKGVTSRQKAWEEATFALNMNRYILQTVSFSVPSEAIACTVGDVVLVQHDMPKWGSAGRLEAGCTSNVLKLDRPVTMRAGRSYQALIHAGVVQKGAGTVASAVGTSLTLNGFDGNTAVRRIVVDGTEVGVERIFQSGSLYGVVTSEPIGSAGSSYTLYNTDDIVTRDVVNPSTGADVEVTEVTLASALSFTPEQFTNFMFGETQKGAKPFRVRSIGGNDAIVRDIVAIEYNASIYDPAGAAPTPNYSEIDRRGTEHAVILGVRETLMLVGSDYQSRVTISFGPASSSQSYSRSEVLVAIGADPFQSIGFGESEASMLAKKDQLLRFRVIARSRDDAPASASSAPETVYRVLGQSLAPDAVEGLGYTFTDAGVRLQWIQPVGFSDWRATIVRKGSSWDSSQLVFNGRATSTTVPFLPTGTTRYVLRHQVGEVPTAGDSFIDVQVSAPTTPTPIASDVQAGSAHIVWGDLKSSQPLKAHEIRVGEDFATATVYATISGSARAHNVTFSGDGSRKLWVRAQDAGGNWGNAGSLTINIDGKRPLDLTPPPKPTNLVVVPADLAFEITWTAAAYTAGGGHRRTHIYAAKWASGAATPSFADAARIGTADSPLAQYTHPSRSGERWAFWITFESIDGVESAPTGPVDAQTPTVVGDIINELVGEITEDHLFQSLRSRINLIDEPGTGLTQKVQDLETTYGSTESAAQSAADAVAAKNASIAARTAAEQARDSASGHAQSAYDHKETAVAAKNAAAGHEANAASSATSAANAVTDAEGAASAAEEARRLAVEAKDTASGHAGTASTKASDAANSAANAAGSESAAATSAGTAASAKTAAETAKTAAEAAKTAAEAAKADAQTASGQASQAKTDADGAASLAASHASNAANSATQAGGSASAASGSASTASTKATEAGNSASAADSSRVAAESAKTAAESSAGAAEASATQAASSASAASTSAQTASTKATEASSSASAASSSANNAATSASSAQTFAGQAATAAETAEGHASAAATTLEVIEAKIVNDFAPDQTWNFENSLDGWTTSNSTLTVGAQSTIYRVTGSDPQLLSPALDLNPKKIDKIRMRMRRVAGANPINWDGALYYRTASRGFDGNFQKTIGKPTRIDNGWFVAEWDMEYLTVGLQDWVEGPNVIQFRIDLDHGAGPSIGTEYEIDWITVGSYGPPVSSAKIKQIDQVIVDNDTATNSRITTLTSTVNGHTSTIQTNQSTQAKINGDLGAQWTLKTDLNGYITGFGLASDIRDGTPYSSIIINADKFVIADSAGPGRSAPKVPFVVNPTTYVNANGVTIPAGVYMDTAFIRELNADYITTGYLKANRIDTKGLDIKDANGNVIFSSGAITLPPTINNAPDNWKNDKIKVENGVLTNVGTVGVMVDNAAVAMGANLVYNADFSLGRDQGWSTTARYANGAGAPPVQQEGINYGAAGVTYQFNGGSGDSTDTFAIYQPTGYTGGGYYEVLSDPIAVDGGKRYMLSVYSGSHRCEVMAFYYFFDASGGAIGNAGAHAAAATNNHEKHGGKNASDWKRLVAYTTLPSNATSVRVVLRKYDTWSGQTDSWAMFTRVMLEQTGLSATEPGPWIAGNNAISSRRKITADNASTFLGAKAVSGTYIADATIGIANINKATITDLSALSANLGNVEITYGGALRSGQWAYNAGTGFWLGSDAGVPKFSIGNPTGNNLRWDGSALHIDGDLIGTGNIKANAVSASASGVLNAAMNLHPSNATDPVTLYVDSGGAPIFINASYSTDAAVAYNNTESGQFAYGPPWIWAEISVNGTVYTSSQAINGALVARVPAHSPGTNTIVLRMYADYQYNGYGQQTTQTRVTAASMWALGMKR